MTELDPPLSATDIKDWKVAKKTKSLRAKPLVNLLTDKSILNKLLLDTLEGKAMLCENSIVCIGDSGDVWQQTSQKLLKKYKVIDINENGWMVCEPYPDNSVDAFQVTFDITTSSGEHYLRALWGEKFQDHELLSKYGPLQRFAEGDWILRNREDHNDVWVVRKKIFDNSYTIIN